MHKLTRTRKAEGKQRVRPATTGSVALAVLAWGVLACGGSASAAEPSCAACHEAERRLFAESAHALTGMSCRDCHGGNPNATDETAHVTDDFRRAGNKKEIAESCAHCHSDVRRMNPYGIPTDQLDRYKTSKHGEQLFDKGDQNVATCTDCHGTHDIHKVKSPQSHVFPTRIPDTCSRCHSDPKRMDPYQLPSDVVAQYKTSYHAHLLFEKGDLSAPTCITCHGNHGATPPGVREVGQVCGKCHGRQRELFEQSPHAEAAAAGAFTECVSCHGNHAIQKTSVDLFDQACVSCHAKDAKPLAVRDTVAGLIRVAKAAYEKASTRVHQATVHGLATDDEQLLLQEARTHVMQLEALQHTLSAELLRPVAAEAEKAVVATLQGIAWLERVEHWKRRSLIPISAFLVVMAVVFWAKRRQIEQQDGS